MLSHFRKPMILKGVPGYITLLICILACESPYNSRHNATLPDVSYLEPYDISWNTPSQNQSGSMPLGNGEVGINVWMTPEGVLHMYLAKTDAFNENAQLLKLGKIALTLNPNPFRDTSAFLQKLILKDGSIRIASAPKDTQPNTEILIWVDANNSVVQLDIVSDQPRSLSVTLDMWRKDTTALTGFDRQAVYGMANYPDSVYVYPDILLDVASDQITWAHRNDTSIWPLTLMHQGLAHLISEQVDPLLHHTFGAIIKGTALRKIDTYTLESQQPLRQHSLSISIHSGQYADLQDWYNALEEQIQATESQSLAIRYHEHQHWWRNFWKRSYLVPMGSTSADTVAQGYILQRFMTACAGRGKLPIKFNGSLFTVGGHDSTRQFTYNADYRKWGGPYWFQNTRLIYWPMLASGDFEMMIPLFDMYMRCLPLAKARVQSYFNHKGAMFPETMYFWGAYAIDNYGWDRTDKPPQYIENNYIRYHYEGALELVSLMIDYYRYTQNRAFLQDTLLPFSEAIFTFYFEHYDTKAQRQIRIYPAQALETYRDVVNPTPVISGLKWNLEQLIQYTRTQVAEDQIQTWQNRLNRLPPIPIASIENKQQIAAAHDTLSPQPQNSENAELYAIFPFRVFGMGKPSIDVARNTFLNRTVKGAIGWRQDDTQAAYLGLTREAESLLVHRMGIWHPESRFPAFWGPNFDWIPDQTHGSNGMKALQTMLLQPVGDSLLLFPAWPRQWDVNFRLHAPQQTIVSGRLENGTLRDLHVSPQHRQNDVLNLLDQSYPN